MPSIIHKYNTRLVTGSIKREKYIDSNNSIESDVSSNTSDVSYIYESSSETSESYESDGSDGSDESDESVYSNKSSSLSNKKTTFNKLEYYKLLNTLYPSKYSNNRVLHEIADVSNSNKNMKDDNIFKKFILRNAMFLQPNNKNNRLNLYKIINKKKNSNSNKKHKFVKNRNTNSKHTNIIINMNNKDKYQEYDDDDDNDEDDDDEDEDDEDDEEDDEDEDEDEYEDDDEYVKKYKKCKTCKGKEGKEEKEEKFDETLVPTLPHISNKNYKIFDKILYNEDKESDYFKKCLSKKEQERVIEKMQELQNLTKIDKPYLLHLVDLDIPDEYKACALRKINTMRSMGGGFGNSEFYKIKSWVDAFLKIPFNKYNNLPISFADGIEKCHDFMEYTKKQLDSVVYGLEDAKIQIMQMVGLWLVNPNAIGCAIAIKGPPGTGKTTLIKEGISKILNRPFALVALGGCGDGGFLDGFDYTYEGSKYGKIIDILIQCGCMNPVILFDELDKLSDSFKGQEVTGVLTHLTDSTQNSKFSDKYFSEISIDMSKALFIFSYNDENAVNNVLKDRMYKIETKGYKTKEKLIIAKEHLLPKIREEIKFDNASIVFNDDLLEYIITDFTEKEDGVRNLKRCLEIIYKKLNLYRLMKPDINLFENNEGLKLKNKISFPCILTREIICNLINKGTTDNIPYGMYN